MSDSSRQAALEQACAGLTLYHFESCPFCEKVRHFIRQHKLPIAMRDIQKQPDYRDVLIQHGGKKQVPCLHVADVGKDTWMYESGDIVRYLSERFVD